MNTRLGTGKRQMVTYTAFLLFLGLVSYAVGARFALQQADTESLPVATPEPDTPATSTPVFLNNDDVEEAPAPPPLPEGVTPPSRF
jgi:hypothetical protein